MNWPSKPDYSTIFEKQKTQNWGWLVIGMSKMYELQVRALSKSTSALKCISLVP